MRGVFIRADGLEIPNNITNFGAANLLSMALCGSDGVLVNPAASFYVGLCDAVPLVTATLADLDEPTIGTNGYARIAVTRNRTGWPAEGNVNGEYFLETDYMTWAATGSGFDKAIGRLFICAEQTAVVGGFMALSEARSALITILPSTPELQRKFKYRIYAR